MKRASERFWYSRILIDGVAWDWPQVVPPPPPFHYQTRVIRAMSAAPLEESL